MRRKSAGWHALAAGAVAILGAVGGLATPASAAVGDLDLYVEQIGGPSGATSKIDVTCGASPTVTSNVVGSGFVGLTGLTPGASCVITHTPPASFVATSKIGEPGDGVPYSAGSSRTVTIAGGTVDVAFQNLFQRDVAVSVTASGVSVEAGSAVTFTARGTNAGLSTIPAGQINLAVSLPSSVVVNPASISPGCTLYTPPLAPAPAKPTAMACTSTGAVAPGAAYTVSIAMTVDLTAAVGSSIVVPAALDFGTTYFVWQSQDPAGNNSASVSVTVLESTAPTTTTTTTTTTAASSSPAAGATTTTRPLITLPAVTTVTPVVLGTGVLPQTGSGQSVVVSLLALICVLAGAGYLLAGRMMRPAKRG